MAYATTDEYTAWLQGRAPTVPLDEFPFWATEAGKHIDFKTFNRLKDVDTLARFRDEVRDTTIALAEIIFGNKSKDAPKELSSYSIGGYSESYVKSDEKADPRMVAIREGLAHTGLLFRGFV